MRVPIHRSAADADDFDSAIRLLTGCGRVDWAKLPVPDADLLVFYWDLVQSEVEASREAMALTADTPIPKIHVDFFDSDVANALVFPRKYGGYWIGISSGTHRIVTSALGHFFRHRDLVPDIGDASSEDLTEALHLAGQRVYTPQDPAPTELTDWSAHYRQLWQEDSLENKVLASAKQPKDPVRRSAYLVCIIAFFHYLALHELGHIFRGHLALLRQRSGSAMAFGEQLLASGKILLPIESHAIEVDADTWANSQILARWGASGNIISYRKLDAGSDYELGDPKLYLRLWFIVHGLFSWIFGRYADLAEYDAKSHPHPDVRLRCLIAWSVAKAGALVDLEKQQLFRECLPLIRADALALRRALGSINPGTANPAPPNLDDPAYSSELHERVTALFFTQEVMTGELGLANRQMVSNHKARSASEKLLKTLPERLQHWQASLGHDRKIDDDDDDMAQFQGAGNIDWVLADHLTDSEDSLTACDIPTGMFSQLVWFEWHLAAPGLQGNPSMLSRVSALPHWKKLMATRHYALIEHADERSRAFRDAVPLFESWQHFLSAVLKAALHLEEPVPWAHSHLGKIAPNCPFMPAWPLIALHQQVERWRSSGAVDRLPADDALRVWVSQWQALNRESHDVAAGVPGRSLINLLCTAPLALLMPPGVDYLHSTQEFLKRSANHIFDQAALQEERADHNAIDAMTYFATALRILDHPRRPFLACAYLINRLSIRSCARVALFGPHARRLITLPSLAERVHEVKTQRHASLILPASSRTDMDGWLRCWRGDIEAFEQYCSDKMTTDAAVDTFFEVLSSTLGKIAAAYRSLSPAERHERPVFRAIDDGIGAQATEVGRIADAARAFLMQAGSAPLQEYFRRWTGEYDSIYRGWLQDNIDAGRSRILASTNMRPEQRAQLVWETRAGARAALGLS